MDIYEDRLERERRARVQAAQREYARLTRVIQRCDQAIEHEQKLTARLMGRGK